MSERCDLAVIGAGAGGLSVAAGAAQLGLNVVLFEPNEMGGDCLNAGCVPSKALLAAAARAQAFRTSSIYGIALAEPQIDWPAVKAHIRTVIETIAPIDSQERFESLGVRVIREPARFLDANTIASDSITLKPRRIVIATGSRPLIPAILENVPHFTNETIFDAPDFPRRLIILGAGPVGIELGQAFRRLGADVIILEAGRALPRFDPECAAIVLGALKREGVDIRENAKAVAAEKTSNGVRVQTSAGDWIEGTHILSAIGRKPTVQGMDLERAGIAYTSAGVTTNPRLRTTNPRVWAVGDIAGREQLTHAAGFHASVFVRNALFKSPSRADVPIPHAVYSDPEIAQIGALEGKEVRWSFAENDRAQTERRPEGFAKLFVASSGRINGAAIVGEGAGDHIQLIALAMANKLTIRALTAFISPYPTRAEIVKRAAGAYYTPLLFSPRTKFLVGLLQRIP